MKALFFLNTYTKMQDYDLTKVILLDYTPIAIISKKDLNLFKDSYSDFFKFFICVEDLSFHEIKGEILSFVKTHNLLSNETRLICLSEDNLLLAAELREYFSIKGMKYKQSELFRDKVKMKHVLQNANILTPRYIDLEIHKDKNVEEVFMILKESIGSKFVIKPKSEFGGLGVRVIKDYTEFQKTLGEIKNDLSLYEAETFIEGDLYHIDSVHVNGNSVFQACCKYSYPNFDFQLGKPCLSIPIPNDTEIYRKAEILVKNVLLALDYKNGSSHLEFFVSSTGEVIFLEVAARTPGAIVIPIYEKMFGFNMLNADLDINLGIEVKKPLHSGKYCFGGIFPIHEGTVTKLNIPDLIGKMEIIWKIKEGDILGKCVSLRDIAAKIVVVNDGYEPAFADFKLLSNFNVIS